MPERVFYPHDFSNGSRWNGSPIQALEDCGECQYEGVLVLGCDETSRICTWGIAYKDLSEPPVKRKCIKRGKEQPMFHVLWNRSGIYKIQERMNIY